MLIAPVVFSWLKLDEFSPIETNIPTLIIFGTSDRLVKQDCKNISLKEGYGQWFKNLSVEQIQGGNHLG